MSALEAVLPLAEPQRVAVETHPGYALAVGDAVLKAIARLDAESQLAVLRWAQAEVQRRALLGRQFTSGIFERHAVTLGQHDAELRQWQAEGLTQAVMAARLGCSRACVSARMRTLRRRAAHATVFGGTP